jgi:hypothetical protein
MTKQIDYLNVGLPVPINQETDHSNFNCTERRAEILREILSEGNSDIPTTKLAQLYGVSLGQISQDKAILLEYVNEHYLKPHKIKCDAIVAKQKALKESLKEGDWKLVNQITNDIIEMAFNLGIIEKSSEKIDLRMKERYLSWFKPKPKPAWE